MKQFSLNKTAIWSFFCLIMFFSSGCYLIPCNLDSGLEPFKNKSKNELFIGSYSVENVNLNIDTKETYLNIFKDGTFKIINTPTDIFDVSSNKKIIVKGKWKYIYIDGKSLISVDYYFKKKDAIDNYMSQWDLFVKDEKPVILVKIGDPDNCSAIRFVKKIKQ